MKVSERNCKKREEGGREGGKEGEREKEREREYFQLCEFRNGGRECAESVVIQLQATKTAIPISQSVLSLSLSFSFSLALTFPAARSPWAGFVFGCPPS